MRISDIKINEHTKGPIGGLNPYNKHYQLIGEEFIGLLREYAKLNPSSHILDIGCGMGRLTNQLNRYIKNGSYNGFDINNNYLDYCKATFNNGRCTFKHLDVYHPEFNHTGQVDAKDVILPYDDNSFDLIVAIAVFNHFELDWYECYLKEISRLLRYRGVFFATLLLNHNYNNAELDFEVKTEHIWYKNKSRPLMNTTISEVYIRQLCIKNGLMIKEPIRYGHWVRSASAITGHDVIIASKGQWQ